MRISTGTEPQSTAYKNLLSSLYANISWELQGPPATFVIECGGYDHPDKGCSAEDYDALAAYTQALLFYLSGDAAHALSSMRIMDAYSSVKQYTNSNAPLQAAWSMSKWTRAAELMLHSGVAWAGADSFIHASLCKCS